MTDYIKYGLIAAAVGLVYLTGYKHAESEGELAIEELKLNHALAILAAQKEEKAKYEETIKSLTRDLDAVRSDRDRRVLELQSFRSRATDCGTCARQRSDLAELAVEGESLLNEASVYLKGGQR